jgi:hypothetical protein
VALAVKQVTARASHPGANSACRACAAVRHIPA